MTRISGMILNNTDATDDGLLILLIRSDHGNKFNAIIEPYWEFWSDMRVGEQIMVEGTVFALNKVRYIVPTRILLGRDSRGEM